MEITLRNVSQHVTHSSVSQHITQSMSQHITQNMSQCITQGRVILAVLHHHPLACAVQCCMMISCMMLMLTPMHYSALWIDPPHITLNYKLSHHPALQINPWTVTSVRDCDISASMRDCDISV